jgi:hypothetical protein
MSRGKTLAEALRFCDSYSRMPVLLDHFDGTLDWFRVLGDEWSGCDNIWKYRSKVAGILSKTGPAERDAMMTDDERGALAALPPVLTVYRGAYWFNKRGLSWTLDRAVAEKFPFLMRYAHHYHGHAPLLLTGRVRRDRCVLKVDRNEVEIIAPRMHITAHERLELCMRGAA